MKIALIGYGKLGKAIHQAATPATGIEVVCVVERGQSHWVNALQVAGVEVVIECTHPEAAFENVRVCLEAAIPVVCGTTGWYARLPEVQALCRTKEGALLTASNFSLGVHLFFALAQQAASLLRRWEAYQPAIEETHHLQKKDKPSGTAITLAEQILPAYPNLEGWELAEGVDATEATILPIRSYREESVPGTHHLHFVSEIDSISIGHTAHSRAGFAQGALMAARWLKGKKGYFTMSDVLGLEG